MRFYILGCYLLTFVPDVCTLILLFASARCNHRLFSVLPRYALDHFRYAAQLYPAYFPSCATLLSKFLDAGPVKDVKAASDSSTASDSSRVMCQSLCNVRSLLLSQRNFPMCRRILSTCQRMSLSESCAHASVTYEWLLIMEQFVDLYEQAHGKTQTGDHLAGLCSSVLTSLRNLVARCEVHMLSPQYFCTHYIVLDPRVLGRRSCCG